jgi:hypothetical protein
MLQNTVNAIDLTNTANTVNDTNTVNTTNQSIAKNVASTLGNSAIMTAGFGVEAKIAQSAPTIAGKIGGLALGLATGTSGIILKNISENINADIFKKKKKFFSVDISKIFNLTGNNAVDLLNIIQFCQYSQIIILLFIFYYFIIININESKLDSFLTKYLPSSLNNNFKFIIFKYINYLKKSSFFLLIFFSFINYS